MSKKLSPSGNDDSISVRITLRDGGEVRTTAYLSPEFDDYGFLRVVSQKECVVVHRDMVSYYSYKLIDNV